MPRGYFVLTPRSNEQPLVLFKLGARLSRLSAMPLSTSTGVDGALSAQSPIGRFIVAWNRFLAADADALADVQSSSAALEHLVPLVLSHLVHCAAAALAQAPQCGESALLTVQGHCFNALLGDASHSPSQSPSSAASGLCLAKELIRGLERTDVYRAVLAFLSSGPSHSGELLGSLVLIPRVRDTDTQSERNVLPPPGVRETADSSHRPLLSESSLNACDCRRLLSDAHMLSALLLAWPYDQITARGSSAAPTTAQTLERLVDAQLLSASCALLNELRQLRTQLSVLLYNSSSTATD